MRDRVFIAWSGTNHIALKVKDMLEKHNYLCCIGGNADNNSKYTSVGDTVIQQIKTCNQAIVIFQNRKDNCVSNNLFFELGYVLSMYGTKKIHCVKKAKEQVVLPSDFDNSFVASIDDTDEETFAKGIVDYFLGRQKMNVTQNKMWLINNRYIIHDMIKSHYSDNGSKCSDYELAQYILFYMESAYLFGDERNIRQEVFEFKQAYHFNFSTELSAAVNICLAFLDLNINLKTVEKDGQSTVFIDLNCFWKRKDEYAHILSRLPEDDMGMFDEWAKAFVYIHLNYIYYLYAKNPNLDKDTSLSLFKTAKDYAIDAICKVEALEKESINIENNDTIGILSLMKSYSCWVLYYSKSALDEGDAVDWLKKALQERRSLKNTFEKGTIDTQLYNYFCMEYYLTMTKYLPLDDTVDLIEKQAYKSEVNEYLESVKEQNNKNAYFRQIELWYQCN